MTTNSFVNGALSSTQTTLTENGALAYNTTGNKMLDFFSIAGSLRSRSEKEIKNKFEDAFDEDSLLAIKTLFYTGDIRGGLGERRTFRVCLKWLAENFPDVVISNLENISHYNRWDSLFTLVGTSVEQNMWEYVKATLLKDLSNIEEGKSISLLAKWMPSINTSSKVTRDLARKACRELKVKSEKHYRKMLSMMRAYLNVTEHYMSAQEWEKIDYEKVPSYAMSRYSKAFFKHDAERFSNYHKAVKAGRAKVNAATLYPYNLTHNFVTLHENKNLMVEEQWEALPNYIEDESNILVMADVSGSMIGRPMETSIGLAIYFAERNKGAYKNLYMSFSRSPKFIEINPNDSLEKKCRRVMETETGYSTNLEAAFSMVLRNAINHKVPPEEMPKAVIIISDMEIDPIFAAIEGRESKFATLSANYKVDFIDEMEKRFIAAGYVMPKLVLWNVESRKDTQLTQNKNVLLFGGQSASTFKNVINSLKYDAYTAMINTLMAERYHRVTL